MTEDVYKVFIVEDNQFYSKLLEHTLIKNPSFNVSIFNNGKSNLILFVLIIIYRILKLTN